MLAALAPKEADLSARHDMAKRPGMLGRNPMLLLEMGKEVLFHLELDTMGRTEKRRMKDLRRGRPESWRRSGYPEGRQTGRAAQEEMMIVEDKY